jgi:beta-lactamase superfamily II metal-dependent hydrolase
VKIDIFDVGHGACSAVTAPNGTRIMVDCGHRKDSPYWWPSTHYQGQRFEALILSNLDEDHVSDFGDVWRTVPLGTVWINPTIDPASLRSMKPQGMNAGVAAVHEYLKHSSGKNLNLTFPGTIVTSFYNSFGTFTDTNNLSLVTFVHYNNFCIVYPGDVETAGWEALLKIPQFRSHLERVRVFITSHHGRENGCCDEVFRICRPDVFIISDKEKVHDTQETTDWYKQHARGIPVNSSLPWQIPETRYVFTTRSDNSITIDVNQQGGYLLTYDSGSQNRTNVCLLSGLNALSRR